MSVYLHFLENSIDEAGTVKFICNEHPYLKDARLLDSKELAEQIGSEAAYQHKLLNMLSTFTRYPALIKVFKKYKGKPVSEAHAMMQAMFARATQILGSYQNKMFPTATEIKSQLNQGHSKTAIAKGCGISRKTLYRILQSANERDQSL